MMNATCRECGRGFEIAESQVGKQSRCPACGGVIQAAHQPVFGAAGEPLAADRPRTCPKCGNTVSAVASLCRRCNTPIGPPQQISAAHVPSNPKPSPGVGTIGDRGKGRAALPPKVARAIQAHMDPDEEILFCVVGASNQSLVALADRLMIVKPGFVAGATFGARVTTFGYEDITAIEANTGLLMGVLEVCTASYQASKTKDYWSSRKDRDPFKISNCVPIAKQSIAAYQPQLQEIRRRINRAKAAPINAPSGGDASTGSFGARASGAPAAGGSSPALSIADELRKLAELKEEGLLSDDEFAAAKSSLLGGRSGA